MLLSILQHSTELVIVTTFLAYGFLKVADRSKGPYKPLSHHPWAVLPSGENTMTHLLAQKIEPHSVFGL